MFAGSSCRVPIHDGRAIPAQPRGSLVSRVRWYPSTCQRESPGSSLDQTLPGSTSAIYGWPVEVVAPSSQPYLTLQPVGSWAPFERSFRSFALRESCTGACWICDPVLVDQIELA